MEASSIAVQGDSSYAFYFPQGTVIDGNVGFGGSVGMTPSKNSSASGATLMERAGTDFGATPAQGA